MRVLPGMVCFKRLRGVSILSKVQRIRRGTGDVFFIYLPKRVVEEADLVPGGS